MTHDTPEYEHAHPEFEPPLDDRLVQAYRVDLIGPTPVSGLERRTLRRLRSGSMLRRRRTYVGPTAIIGALAAAAVVVFAAGFTLGERHMRGPIDAGGADAARIRAAGEAYARVLAAADPGEQTARDAAVASFHDAGLVVARLAPDDEYGATVRLALSDAIRMAPRPQPIDSGGAQWF